MTGNRWPGWVYDEGDEPDYRFTFANERTFLAWIRTSLALVAAGVALDVVSTSSSLVRHWLSGLLVGLGLLAAGSSWLRWATSERAMRRAAPLPGLRISAILTCLLLVGILTLLIASR